MAFKTKCVGSVYFASWGNSTAGAPLPQDKQKCLKWSHDKFKRMTFSLDNSICKGLVQWMNFVIVSVLASYISGFLFACVNWRLTLTQPQTLTLVLLCVSYLSRDHFNQSCLTKGKIATTFASRGKIDLTKYFQ